METKTILATCYAVNPYKGSEDGMGWNFIRQMARFNKVIAITRENNREMIEKFQQENPDPTDQQITFLYFDLPYWMRFWKKGSRGALLYYYLWQRGIIRFVKKMNLCFDIVHNVNFHNDWTPSFLWKLNKPLVWGPIGHHPLIPKSYMQNYQLKDKLKDQLTWLVKKLFWNFSPALKQTVQKAKFIWCMNSDVAGNLKLQTDNFGIMPSVATNDFFTGKSAYQQGFTAISVGRFVPLKGFDLTIESFSLFMNGLSAEEKEKCQLLLIGTGPEKMMLERLINEKNMEKHVRIIEWIDREKLMEFYRRSSVFLFPSHEGAGMVVAEALSFSLPVICLDNAGPGEFISEACGFAVPQSDYQSTVQGLSDALLKTFRDEELREKMSLNARKHFLNHFNWNKRGEQLQQVYNAIS